MNLPVPTLEACHRAAIARLNINCAIATVFFKDAVIESEIRPIVSLLNSCWTVTGFSCGGHLDPIGGFIPPYVSFFVLSGKYTAWRRIERALYGQLSKCAERAMPLDVAQGFELPAQKLQWRRWGFGTHFKKPGASPYMTEQDWRVATDGLISMTSRLLTAAMEAEQVAHPESL